MTTANAKFEITAVDKTAAAFAAVQGHLSKLDSTLSGLKNLAFASVLGAGMMELGRKVYDATVQWQSWQYTLEGAGLSSQQTATQLKFLQDTSEQLGLNIKDVGSSFSRFVLTGKAAGMTIADVDQGFKAVSEAMRVFHLSSQQSTRSWLAITEVMSMGTLHSRQFTQQLGRDWPGIGALIAQAMYPGENSLKRFMEAMDKGQISSQQFVQGIERVMQTPPMQGALAEAENSLQAATGRLSTSFFNLFNQADSPALTDMIDAINSLNSAVNNPQVKSGIEELISGLASLVKYSVKGLANIGKLYGYIADQVGENVSRTTFAHVQKDFAELEKMVAAHQQNTAAYKALYADFHSSEQYLVDRGVGAAGSMSDAIAKVNAAIKAAGGNPNAVGGADSDALHDLIYGNGKSAPWMEGTEESLRFANAMPAEAKAAQKVTLGVKFDEASAEESLRRLTKELQKTSEDSINSLFQTDLQHWQDLFAPINEAFTQTVTGVIRGTETWHMGMKKMFASLEQEFLRLGVSMVTDWAASEMAKLQVSEATGMSQVAISQVVGKQSTAASLESDAKVILGSAWTAAANVYKSVSAIPFIGWILAPAMAIAAAVEVAGFAKRIASAEGGWWQVPSDQLANIHKDEMVLPRHLAAPLRENIESGGSAGGNTHHTYNIAALDARSMAEVLKRNPDAVAKAVQKAIRGHHLH